MTKYEYTLPDFVRFLNDNADEPIEYLHSDECVHCKFYAATHGEGSVREYQAALNKRGMTRRPDEFGLFKVFERAALEAHCYNIEKRTPIYRDVLARLPWEPAIEDETLDKVTEDA